METTNKTVADFLQEVEKSVGEVTEALLKAAEGLLAGKNGEAEIILTYYYVLPHLPGLKLAEQPLEKLLQVYRQTKNPPVNTRKRKLEEFVEDLLTCRVCLLVPRPGPVGSCPRGHWVCGVCRPKLETCPECRLDLSSNSIRPEERRNIPVDMLLDYVAAERSFSCKYEGVGCTTQLSEEERTGSTIGKHENTCHWRTVECPGNFRYKCSFTGNVRQVIDHCKLKCGLVLHTPKGEMLHRYIFFLPKKETFFSFFTNVARPAGCWKPHIFISKMKCAYMLIHLIMSRSEKGVWLFYPRAMSEQRYLDSIVAVLTVKGVPGRESETPQHIYRGKISSNHSSEADIIRSGNYLSLSDSQINSLGFENMLFAYEVRLEECS